MDAGTFDKTVELLAALNRCGVEYKVIEGVAMIAHGLARPTSDVDFFINPTSDNVERLKEALRSVWDDPEIDSISYEDLSGDYPAVAYGPPDDSIGVDILARLGEAFEYATVESEEKSLGDIRIRVATAAMLYRMKCGTVRAKDHADAEFLNQTFGVHEE